MKRLFVLPIFMMMVVALYGAENVQVVYGCVLGEFGKKEVKQVFDRNHLSIWKEDESWLYSSGSVDYLGATWNGVDACFEEGTLVSLFFSIDLTLDDSIFLKVEACLNDRYRFYADISDSPFLQKRFANELKRPDCKLWAKGMAGQEIVLLYSKFHLVLMFNNMGFLSELDEQRHPSFCGVHLGNGTRTFCQELVKAGFHLHDMQEDKSSALMSGYYCGYPVSLIVWAKEGYVTNLWVMYEPANPTWNMLKGAYDSMKNELKREMGAPTNCVEEFYDGYSARYGLQALLYEGCKFETDYDSDRYYYNLSIARMAGYMTALFITDRAAIKYFEE